MIKVNDLVYIPHISSSIFTVKCTIMDDLYVDDDHGGFDFYDDGKAYPDDNFPLVYLATPENKARLEDFYGITLEDIPVNEKVENH